MEDFSARPSRRSLSWAFYILWSAILIVSVHDGMLVLANRWTILEYERNPFGLFLLQLAGGNVWLLLVTKALGTIVVGAALLVIYWSRPRLGWAVCIGLTIVQVALLLILTFAER